MKSKWIILIFVGVIITIASLGVVKANRVEEIVDSKNLDSIIQSKIDYRFTSYDGKFMYENLVVIDKDSVIVGRLIIYTNNEDVENYYNSDPYWMKTRFYENLKNRKLSILEKKE